MQDSILLPLLLQLALIACNAVFACAEIAVITMNDARIDHLAAARDKRALKLQRLTGQPARFLATIQVAITLSGFLGSAFAADNFAGRITDAIVAAGTSINADALHTAAVILITLILSYVTLVFGELVPKRVAMRKAEKLALGLAGIISFISVAFKPLVSLLTASTNGVLRLMGIDPDETDEEYTEENIRMMVDAGSEHGAIKSSEAELIENIFEFNDTTVGDILTHRTQVAILYLEESDAEWAETIHSNRFSHYPVCDDTADDVRGVLDAKEYFRLDDKRRANVVREAVSPARFVPESARADAVFAGMQKSRNHFAVVLDEYGGMSGIVTMSDLLEELVGDLTDGSDAEDECALTLAGNNTWIAKGNVPLDVITDELHIEFPSDEFDTLNGLVIDAIGRVPEDGETFETDAAGLHIRVGRVRDHCVVGATISLL